VNGTVPFGISAAVRPLLYGSTALIVHPTPQCPLFFDPTMSAVLVGVLGVFAEFRIVIYEVGD
jgi:hypothetical protein